MILRQKRAGEGRENILGRLDSVSVLRREKEECIHLLPSLSNVPLETHITATLGFKHFTNILPPQMELTPHSLVPHLFSGQISNRESGTPYSVNYCVVHRD